MTRLSDIGLQGVDNFRDFGGALGADGRRVRLGRLYRSGHHGRVTDDDLTRLADLDFALVVDLRRAGERSRDPSRRPPSSRAEVLEHAGAIDRAAAPHLAFLATPEATPERAAEQMMVGYRGYPFDPHYVALFRDYFARLPDLDGPVLIHCHAGKDRTGVLCALTLHALGVARDDIYTDYLATNLDGRLDARITDAAGRFHKLHGRPPGERLLRQMMSADRAYLDAAFAAIEAAHGDIDAYLAEALAVTADLRNRIRARLLA